MDSSPPPTLLMDRRQRSLSQMLSFFGKSLVGFLDRQKAKLCVLFLVFKIKIWRETLHGNHSRHQKCEFRHQKQCSCIYPTYKINIHRYSSASSPCRCFPRLLPFVTVPALLPGRRCRRESGSSRAPPPRRCGLPFMSLQSSCSSRLDWSWKQP